MLDRELDSVVTTIEGARNPEIHHYNHGSHPGIGWYIKTILPGPDILTEDTSVIHQFWKRITENHPKLVRMVFSAYDWSGAPINGWYTVWLSERIDIKCQYDIRSGFDYQLVDYDTGLKSSAAMMRNTLDHMLQSRPTGDNRLSYEHLSTIVNFVETYTTDKRSKQNRAKLKVITDGQIHPKITD